MTIDPFRWALPHKGPPTHLTTPEYVLRRTVFSILHVVTMIPTIIFILIMAFGGFIAIPFFLAFSGAFTADFQGFDPADKELFFVAVVVWAVSIVSNIYIQKRFLTFR